MVRGEIALSRVPLRLPRGGRGRRGAAAAVDLTIRPGETVALVGETGAGKSTVMKLVARFYDPTAGGCSSTARTCASWTWAPTGASSGTCPRRRSSSRAPSGTTSPTAGADATDAEVERAARAVGAHDFIAGLPGGYRHVVTERGRSLSAGQRQLIALARAQLVDPAILLLDEATSNLDLGTEARVSRAMGIVAQGRTTILIAHRLPDGPDRGSDRGAGRRAGGRGRHPRGAAGPRRPLRRHVAVVRPGRRGPGAGPRPGGDRSGLLDVVTAAVRSSEYELGR